MRLYIIRARDLKIRYRNNSPVYKEKVQRLTEVIGRRDTDFGIWLLREDELEKVKEIVDEKVITPWFEV